MDAYERASQMLDAQRLGEAQEYVQQQLQAQNPGVVPAVYLGRFGNDHRFQTPFGERLGRLTTNNLAVGRTVDLDLSQKIAIATPEPPGPRLIPELERRVFVVLNAVFAHFGAYATIPSVGWTSIPNPPFGYSTFLREAITDSKTNVELEPDFTTITTTVSGNNSTQASQGGINPFPLNGPATILGGTVLREILRVSWIWGNPPLYPPDNSQDVIVVFQYNYAYTVEGAGPGTFAHPVRTFFLTNYFPPDGDVGCTLTVRPLIFARGNGGIPTAVTVAKFTYYQVNNPLDRTEIDVNVPFSLSGLPSFILNDPIDLPIEAGVDLAIEIEFEESFAGVVDPLDQAIIEAVYIFYLEKITFTNTGFVIDKAYLDSVAS